VSPHPGRVILDAMAVAAFVVSMAVAALLAWEFWPEIAAIAEAVGRRVGVKSHGGAI
jgi:hypothetical protein